MLMWMSKVHKKCPMNNSTNLPPGDWHQEFINAHLIQAEHIERTILEKRTSYQDMVIIEGKHYGKSLILDGKTQSTALDEFIYHEALVHPAMVLHRYPKTILLAGGGEGCSAREILKHDTVTNLTMVDIDVGVLEACKEHLSELHGDSFGDKRVNLVISDIRDYLKETTQMFDVIIIDVPDPLENGPAYKIFTKEFYELLKTHLNQSGTMVTQSGPTSLSYDEDCFYPIVNTVKTIFSNTTAYEVFVPSYGSTWGFTLALHGNSALTKSSLEIDEILSSRNVKDLKMYDGEAHCGLHSLPKYLRKSLAIETRIITDKNPLFVK